MSQKKKSGKIRLNRFDELVKTARELIDSGKRSPTMVKALLDALRKFKNNRKELTLPSTPLEQDSEQFNRVLSLKLAATTLGADLQQYFSQHGIFYVGEIYQFTWKFGAHAKNPQGRIRAQVEDFLTSLRLPRMFDLNTAKWLPPYATPILRALLKEPAISVLLSPAQPPMEKSPKYRLYRFAKTNKWLVKDLFKLGRNFEEIQKNLCTREVRAGMWVPEWWVTQ